MKGKQRIYQLIIDNADDADGMCISYMVILKRWWLYKDQTTVLREQTTIYAKSLDESLFLIGRLMILLKLR